MNKTGQKLYSKAKKIILGGNMLLSKRPELTLPNFWPTYYSKAKGIFVWDLASGELLRSTNAHFKKVTKKITITNNRKCY